MDNTSRSIFRESLFLTAMMGCVAASVYAGTNINCDFESGTVEKWQKNSDETELTAGTDDLSTTCGNYALVASGTSRQVGANYYARVPVTDRTIIEFDVRCDSEKPLAYLAFSATDNSENIFWLFADKQNAIKNPKRGEWFHFVVPAAALKTNKGDVIEDGNALKTFGIFQVQPSACLHRLMMDNFKIYEKDGAIEAVDPQKFMDTGE